MSVSVYLSLLNTGRLVCDVLANFFRKLLSFFVVFFFTSLYYGVFFPRHINQHTAVHILLTLYVCIVFVVVFWREKNMNNNALKAHNLRMLTYFVFVFR